MIFTWIVFIKRTNKNTSVLFYKTKEKPEKTDESKEKQSVLYFPFSNAELSVSPRNVGTMQSRETPNHADATQAGDEHSTQKSAKYIDEKIEK